MLLDYDFLSIPYIDALTQFTIYDLAALHVINGIGIKS